MQDNFKTTVQNMTAKEIIMAMVEGLKNPVIKVKMDTFGESTKGVCFGCAATNAVCKISGKVFTKENIDEDFRNQFLKTDGQFLNIFELGIDNLRAGSIRYYNSYAKEIGMAQIKCNGKKLPKLGNDYTPTDLQAYINLANAQS